MRDLEETKTNKKYEELIKNLRGRLKSIRELEQESRAVVDRAIRGGYLHSYYQGKAAAYAFEAEYLERLLTEANE